MHFFIILSFLMPYSDNLVSLLAMDYLRLVFASEHGAGIRPKYVLVPCSALGKHRFVPVWFSVPPIVQYQYDYVNMVIFLSISVAIGVILLILVSEQFSSASSGAEKFRSQYRSVVFTGLSEDPRFKPDNFPSHKELL